MSLHFFVVFLCRCDIMFMRNLSVRTVQRCTVFVLRFFVLWEHVMYVSQIEWNGGNTNDNG